jgi:hypothetical protein
MKKEISMAFEGYIDYQRREFCKDLPCPVQLLLEAATLNSKEYDQIRGICQNSCTHTTYEFHHLLIQKGYLIVRPAEK